MRVAIPRNVTCPANLSGSVGNSRVAAAGGLGVLVNVVSAGVDFNVGGVNWALGQTVGVPDSAVGFPTGFMMANGDDVEFVFPATADATFADIAITLKCART